MRFVLAGGGTGGHVYPALSVAEALRRLEPAAQFLYIGTARGAEQRLVPAAGLPFRAIKAGQIRGKSPFNVTRSASRLSIGVLESRRILTAFRPYAVFATGGYASVPVALAARLSGLPLIVFLPDIYPGWAVRLSAGLASRVATTTEAAQRYLPARKTVVTGYPLRPEFSNANRAAGRGRLGLGNGPVVLVSGASSGSLALNEAVLSALVPLLQCCELVHLTGPRDELRVQDARDRLPATLRGRYHVYGYLSDIAWAMAAADLAVLRAGASSLSEPPAVGLPTILVPGTFSDQRRNAGYLQSQGASVLLDQERLPELLSLVRGLLAAPEKLAAMSAAARRLARPLAAETLAGLLIDPTGTGIEGQPASHFGNPVGEAGPPQSGNATGREFVDGGGRR